MLCLGKFNKNNRKTSWWKLLKLFENDMIYNHHSKSNDFYLQHSADGSDTSSGGKYSCDLRPHQVQQMGQADGTGISLLLETFCRELGGETLIKEHSN